MPQVIEPLNSDADGRYAIAVSRYNETITSRLLDGAVETLVGAGVPDGQIDVAWAPGAWELPLVAAELAASDRYQAILCWGAVSRGETTHDQHINRQVSSALGNLSLEQGLPILFGVLTCQSLEQALNRAGGSVGNKGHECAEAALEMVGLLQALRQAAQ